MEGRKVGHERSKIKDGNLKLSIYFNIFLVHLKKRVWHTVHIINLRRNFVFGREQVSSIEQSPRSYKKTSRLTPLFSSHTSSKRYCTTMKNTGQDVFSQTFY